MVLAKSNLERICARLARISEIGRMSVSYTTYLIPLVGQFVSPLCMKLEGRRGGNPMLQSDQQRLLSNFSPRGKPTQQKFGNKLVINKCRPR